MRRSRHTRPASKPDFDIRATERSIATLQLFDRYRILPLNYMHALAGGGSYVGYRHLCKRLFWAGLLDRRTLNAARNNNETMNYSRSSAGSKFLIACGHPTSYETLPNDTHHDNHQILSDIAEAQIELGARTSSTEYHPWLDILHHPATPPLPPRPFRFEVNGSYQVPDGRPFYLKEGSRSALFIRELDRNTEAKETIKTKLRHYRLLETTIKQRYGFARMFLLFITTDTTRAQNILRLIGEVFPSGCKWITVSVLEDHIKLLRTTPALSTDLFHKPHERAGHTPFLLDTLTEF